MGTGGCGASFGDYNSLASRLDWIGFQRGRGSNVGRWQRLSQPARTMVRGVEV
jgi:hypothetical protein